MSGLFSPLSINLHTFWHLPPYLACFWSPWSEDSLILTLFVVRSRPSNKLDCQTPLLANSRPDKSYTREVSIYASRSALPDVLNLIFKARFTRFRVQFNHVSQNLQQKNARDRSRPCDSFCSLFGRQRELFLMMLLQEACLWIFSLLG